MAQTAPTDRSACASFAEGLRLVIERRLVAFRGDKFRKSFHFLSRQRLIVGNYILAAMIAEKASGKSFTDLVHQLVIEPFGLSSAFYEAGTYPEPVIKRLSHGYFEQRGAIGGV
jgi:hypothetical protein